MAGLLQPTTEQRMGAPEMMRSPIGTSFGFGRALATRDMRKMSMTSASPPANQQPYLAWKVLSDIAILLVVLSLSAERRALRSPARPGGVYQIETPGSQ